MLTERAPGMPERAEDTWDQKEMPFTEHLRELRTRLIISLGSIAIIALVLFWPSQFVIVWMKNEYFGKTTILHAFSPTDVIGTEFKFSIYGAIVLGLPIILYQSWMFVMPAFAPKTRRAVYSYIFPAFVLALLGLVFCHFFIIGRIVNALMAITNGIAEPTFGIDSSLNLILLTFLAFAIIFETPMVMVGLARVGLVNPAMLRTYRRYAIMGILLFGGVAAPDASPFTMMLIATPMYVLYEASIWIIVVLERGWRRTALAAGDTLPPAGGSRTD